MARRRWAATVLCLAAVVAAQIQWPVPPVPEQFAFQSIPDDRFSLLRRQARQFVEARPRQGFEFVEKRGGAVLQIYCRGVPVLWLERRSHYLLLQVSLDARQRAPDVVRFRALLQWQMEPLDYLEQVLAGVPEPVLMDRVLQAVAGEVTDGARCGAQ
ncbi:hypothetical protein [Stenotrophomonas maltophilia]|uniref:hypothetical protein n=1 Tax=Stenotrophomonas maltophilia group TaxID=995085 RepID=UPI000709ED74|nr:hypothetical protein [Stenotrophomonas maltophilia]KRG51102.1 hypothetical protein ARC02_15955 [Stenotrophomonas maltophilia]NNH47897.1 hypothetical protein [Stenotrophomonas maltophilia]VEE51526.1 cold shock protein [Stenotrophomonas maltophilia]